MSPRFPAILRTRGMSSNVPGSAGGEESSLLRGCCFGFASAGIVITVLYCLCQTEIRFVLLPQCRSRLREKNGAETVAMGEVSVRCGVWAEIRRKVESGVKMPRYVRRRPSVHVIAQCGLEVEKC